MSSIPTFTQPIQSIRGSSQTTANLSANQAPAVPHSPPSHNQSQNLSQNVSLNFSQTHDTAVVNSTGVSSPVALQANSKVSTPTSVNSAQSRSALVSMTKGFLGAAGLQVAASDTASSVVANITEPSSSLVVANVDAQDVVSVFGDTDNGSDSADVSGDNPTDETEADSTTKASVSGDSEYPEQQQEIAQLESRDAEVRAHEQAHAATGGIYAGQPNLTFESGPDGRRYAVDGEVQIDVSVVHGNPEATMRKMQQVYAAAMAPMEPSSADLRVAAEAMRKYNEAKAQAAELRIEKSTSAIKAAEGITDTEAKLVQNQADNVNNAWRKQRYPMGLALVMSKLNPSVTETNTDLENFTIPNAELENATAARMLQNEAYSTPS
ncbi:hypothetical protein JYB87_08735 [Shewanella avicenniae]|uniref:SprA-related family protein n=1 Tax=Shewanella avicenniae TaxID=2814294 RepID=A0ABX7QX95_9GAMM|nr:putative metalloprotease CJM1_0395 family protein [Shewanella avicenniae]QSX35258.1 hypothetical protein JYB87_08735 [Shewanella avicenniae]